MLHFLKTKPTSDKNDEAVRARIRYFHCENTSECEITSNRGSVNLLQNVLALKFYGKIDQQNSNCVADEGGAG